MTNDQGAMLGCAIRRHQVSGSQHCRLLRQLEQELACVWSMNKVTTVCSKPDKYPPQLYSQLLYSDPLRRQRLAPQACLLLNNGATVAHLIGRTIEVHYHL